MKTAEGEQALVLQRPDQSVQRALVEQTPRGPMIPQQVLLSANSFFIILGVVGMAWLTRKLRTLTALLIVVAPL